MTPKAAWFELSNEGWHSQNQGRGLSSLIYEGIQNALDSGAERIDVSIDEESIVIEDDGKGGFADPKLAYTVFLTDKATSAIMRGRHGRGLKQLISIMDAAVVDTIGCTISFDADGRAVIPNRRERGTVLRMARQTQSDVIEETLATLAQLIPPETVTVRLNGDKVKRPKLFAVLRGCVLETIVRSEGVEQSINRDTTVTLYKPRARLEVPYLYEMGLPVQPLTTPWHVDVGQRVPREPGGEVHHRYRLRLFATLFESLVHKTLDAEDLKGEWVKEVLTRCSASDEAIKAYASRAFRPRTVLSTGDENDHHATRAGATVLDPASLSERERAALDRVLPTSAQYLRQREAVQETVHAKEPYEERALTFFGLLAKRILGRRVSITLMRRPPTETGLIENAVYDRKRHIMRINVAGQMDLRAPLSARTLAIFFHELAHAYVTEHDAQFIEHLEQVAGRGAEILTREGVSLAASAGIALDSSERHQP